MWLSDRKMLVFKPLNIIILIDYYHITHILLALIYLTQQLIMDMTIISK